MIVRIGCIALLIYAALLGAHYRGILLPQVRLMSLLLLASAVVIWLVIRTRAGWRWQRTALDIALPLWGLAFGLSLLFNLDASYRILLGLWYMGVYVGLWYLLQDLLAHWKSARKVLVDGLLFIGVLVLLLTVVEWQAAQTSGANLLNYRFRGLFGNPNLLGTFLAVVLLIALGRLWSVRSRLLRVGLALYIIACASLLFLTESRSAWIGTGVGLLIWIVLQANLYKWVQPSFWWHGQSSVRRIVFSGILVGLIAASSLSGLWLARTISESERGLSLRPELFNITIHMFNENPLAGRGLFTFGRHQSRFMSMPPSEAHSHAHNAGFQIAGELGLVGLAAAGLTIIQMFRTARTNRQQLPDYARAEWHAAAAATLGMGAVHMVDVTSMLPIIALISMITLALTTAPRQPDSPAPGSTPRTVGLVALWVVLFVTGLWDSQAYSRYNDILWDNLVPGNYVATAASLQPLAHEKPNLVIYPAQQAFLWGLAAAEGNTDAQQRAIAAYERVIALEPYYAPHHANLAALYWHAGDQQNGLASMQQAAALAPQSWSLQYNLGTYAESLGMTDAARAAYELALLADPDADLHPSWGETPLQASIRSQFEERSLLAQVMLLAENGETDAALGLWNSEPDQLIDSRFVQGLLALEQGNRNAAQQYYDDIARVPQFREGSIWLRLLDARIAQFDGDSTRTSAVLADIQTVLHDDPLSPDYGSGADIAYYQFMHLVIPRQFLPQVSYTMDLPVLLYLLHQTEQAGV